MKTSFLIMKNYILKNGKLAILTLALSLSIVITLSSIVLSLQREIEDKMIALLSFDYTVVTYNDYDKNLLDKIKNLDGVNEVYVFNDSLSLCKSKFNSLLVNQRKVEPSYLESKRLNDYIVFTDKTKFENHKAYVSLKVANILSSFTNDKIQIVKLNNKKRVDTKEYNIQNMFLSHQSLFDSSYILVTQSKNDIKNASYGVFSISSSKNIKELEKQGYTVKTLESDFSSLVGALKLEKFFIFIFLIIMLLIIILFIYQMLKRFFLYHGKALSMYYIFGINRNWIYKLSFTSTLIIMLFTSIFGISLSFIFINFASKLSLFRSVTISISYSSILYFTILTSILVLVFSLIEGYKFKKKEVLELMYGKKY